MVHYVRASILLALITISFSSTHCFLIRLVQDLILITRELDEMNKQNREALFDGLKRIVTPQSPKQQQIISPTEEKPNDTSSSFLTRIFSQPKDGEVQKAPFSFKDIAGGIPQEVIEVAEFIKSSERFRKIGAQMPKGILLVGPPGTGKTSLARALAGEAGAFFIDAAGSQFIEIWVGNGARKIRELFDQARDSIQHGPYKKAIIFIDEIDAIGGSRSSEMSSEYRGTLNELLNQMDGFKKDDSIVVLAATNNVEILDSALLRPGRFDRIVEIGLPNVDSREAIVSHYTKKTKHDPSINFMAIAQETHGFSGAELKNLVNEAAIRAARENALIIEQKHFDIVIHDLKKKKRTPVFPR